MSDAHSTQPPYEPTPGGHLEEWTLALMAEGELPPGEVSAARLHLRSCAHCSSELEAQRALVGLLASLPRFEPSPGFGDAVIARTRMTPEPSPLALWLRRLAPKTRRGWVLLGTAAAAPAIPIIAAALWLLTHPLLTPGGLWTWAVGEGREAVTASAAVALRWAASTGFTGFLEGAYVSSRALPSTTVLAVAVLFAVAMPLSVWAIVRLVRTPMEDDVTYAS